MSKIDKKEEIIRASLEIIAEHGFHGAPMAMIADRAGVGAGTIYRYFENKDVLIKELYKEIESRMTSIITVGYSSDLTIRERFIHLSTQLIHYFINHPLEFRYVEQFHNSPYGAEFRKDKILGVEQGCNVYRTLFEDGVTKNEIKNFPLTILFSLAFGPVIHITRDHILDFIILDEPMIDKIAAACWDGVKL